LSRGEPRELRLALLGFGSVGRRFAELLSGPYGRALRAAGVRPRITGVATARHGLATDPRGLPVRRCLALVRSGRSLESLHRGPRLSGGRDFIRNVPADVLLEITTLDPRTGQPAMAHVRAALRRGLHVVTANKGPVAFGLASLESLARRHDRRFLFEGAVMDGTPVFNLVRRCLPAVRVLGFRGVLNATTTRILSAMEAGSTAAQALREVQAAGVAEADPANDVEGWDAAVKGCALANALMGARLTPPQVRRRGIGSITPARVRAARRAGKRTRLVVRGSRTARGVRVTVAPEQIPLGDLLVTEGADGTLLLETDLMGEVAVWEGAAGVDQTAYALLSDLLTIVGLREA